jgi:hypothetical protein
VQTSTDPAAAFSRLLLYLNDCSPGCGCDNDRFFLQAARIEGWLADDGVEAGLAAELHLREILGAGGQPAELAHAIGGRMTAEDLPAFLEGVRRLLARALETFPADPPEIALAEPGTPCGDGTIPDEPLKL